jgi:hypothetical protein
MDSKIEIQEPEIILDSACDQIYKHKDLLTFPIDEPAYIQKAYKKYEHLFTDLKYFYDWENPNELEYDGVQACIYSCTHTLLKRILRAHLSKSDRDGMINLLKCVAMTTGRIQGQTQSTVQRRFDAIAQVLAKYKIKKPEINNV